MSEEAASGSLNLVGLTAEIVSAYVSNNPIPTAELANLIASVYAAVAGLGTTTAVTEPAQEVQKPTPAQIRKSVTEDGLVSFLDGKTYKTLKRHLGANGLDPRSYRERFGLPAGYPMVAPPYAAQRSALAKQIGLGRQGAATERQEQASTKRRQKAA